MANIYISPGHGGQYTGTSGNKFVEKHLNLEMAKLVQDHLRDYECIPRLAREGDYTKLISHRVLEANNWPATLVVSLHFNGHTLSSTRGFETFVHSSLPRYSPIDNIRNIIHDSIYSILKSKTPNRGKKTADFQILRETKMHAVLIEYLFITNQQDATLVNPMMIKMAEATAAGIAKALELKKKDEGNCRECERLKAEVLELNRKLSREILERNKYEQAMRKIQSITGDFQF